MPAPLFALCPRAAQSLLQARIPRVLVHSLLPSCAARAQTQSQSACTRNPDSVEIGGHVPPVSLSARLPLARSPYCMLMFRSCLTLTLCHPVPRAPRPSPSSPGPDIQTLSKMEATSPPFDCLTARCPCAQHLQHPCIMSAPYLTGISLLSPGSQVMRTDDAFPPKIPATQTPVQGFLPWAGRTQAFALH